MASHSVPGVYGRRPDVFDRHIEEMPPHRAVLGAVEAKLMTQVPPRLPVREIAAGGVFAATLPSEHFPDFLLGSSLFRSLHLPGLARAYGDFFNRISYHYHVYPLETWRTKLEAAGLRVVEHRYYFSAAAHRAL